MIGLPNFLSIFEFCNANSQLQVASSLILGYSINNILQ